MKDHEDRIKALEIAAQEAAETEVTLRLAILLEKTTVQAADKLGSRKSYKIEHTFPDLKNPLPANRVFRMFFDFFLAGSHY